MDKERKIGFMGWLKRGIMAECLLVAVLAAVFIVQKGGDAARESASSNVLTIENDYIKWVDFTVSYEALCKAYEWDVKTHGTEHEINWVELLAYTAARTGGTFDNNALKIMEKAAKTLSEGDKTIEEMTSDMKYYAYYKEAYDAAVGGLVGEYQAEGKPVYGLKGYFPLAQGFDYTHYDDFGVSRSYGYKRQHLGSYVIIVSSWREASKIKVFH